MAGGDEFHMVHSRIFWRLFGAYSLLLALALGSLGWAVAGRIEARLLDDIRHNLEIKTVLLRDQVTALGLGSSGLQKKITKLGRETESRITVIADDGRVLADSHEDPAHMENHGTRPEVLQAKSSGAGASTRFSTTV